MKPAGRGGCATVLAVALVVVLPVLYVASVGPAIWMFEHGVVSEEAVLRVYAPVIWAAASSPTIRDAFQWYIALWETPVMESG